jgi:NAD+ kinase
MVSSFGLTRLKLQKVLVLHKKSTFQLQAIEHRESRFVKLLEQGHPVVTRVKQAHSEHAETLKRLEQELLRRKIEFKTLVRSELTSPVTDVDLLISVGGDGTFLDASHYLDSVPILGVNSSGSSSFGHLCSANEKTLARVLDEIASGKMQPYQLTRLELYLNGELLPELVLNELLVGHNNPAATSRYFIELRGKQEEQRSSGVWIGPATGSTGSIRSAGGIVLPITDSRYQYLVREPCIRPNERWQLLKGVLQMDESIKIISQMRTGAIFVDGQHIDYQFYLGDQLTVKTSPKPLNAYVSPDVNEVFLGKEP